MEGHGVMYYNYGGRYEGYWVSNMREGHGVEYYEDGSVERKGIWKEDKFVESK
jgi:hypothetical protein